MPGGASNAEDQRARKPSRARAPQPAATAGPEDAEKGNEGGAAPENARHALARESRIVRALSKPIWKACLRSACR